MLEQVYNSRISHVKVSVHLLPMLGMALGRWQILWVFREIFPFYTRGNNPPRIRRDVSWKLIELYFAGTQEILSYFPSRRAVESQERWILLEIEEEHRLGYGIKRRQLLLPIGKSMVCFFPLHPHFPVWVVGISKTWRVEDHWERVGMQKFTSTPTIEFRKGNPLSEKHTIATIPSAFSSPHSGSIKSSTVDPLRLPLSSLSKEALGSQQTLLYNRWHEPDQKRSHHCPRL